MRANDSERSKKSNGGVFGAMKNLGGGGAVAGIFATGSKTAAKEADKELTKAHSREVNRLTAELEEMSFKAELHVDMSSTLSGVVKTLYARNLQLEDMLRGAGVEVNAEASQHSQLIPLRIDSIAGFQIGQLDAGRECPDGDLRALARTAMIVVESSSGSGVGPAGLPPVPQSPAVR